MIIAQIRVQPEWGGSKQVVPTRVLYVYISMNSIFGVLLLPLVLHKAQPAALTAVAMETSGVSEEKAVDQS